MVAALLRRSLPHDAVQLVDLGGDQGVSFDFDGRDYLVSFAQDVGDAGTSLGQTVTRAVRAAGLTGRPGETRWALLYWSDDHVTIDKLVDSVQEFGIILDRTHLEAAVAGLVPLAQLVRDVFRRRQPYVPLADLLAGTEFLAESWRMTPAARLTATLGVEIRMEAGVTAEVLLVGQAQPVPPTGMTWHGPDQVLITCPEGVMEVDIVRGHTRWVLALPGCEGAPLVAPDGAMLALCGSVLVRWHQGRLRVVAGGFEPGAALVPGPEREPWVLSGSGVTFGTGKGTLALTRIGDAVGDQLRYPITFEAAVRSAAWLGGRRFFLAAGGHSAVIDLTRTTDAGTREEWIPTAGHDPAHLLATGTGSVVSASPDGSGNRITVHRTDLATRTGEPLAEVRLGRVFGLTQDPASGAAYLLASLPGNDHERVRPVLMRLTGHWLAAVPGAPTPTAENPAAASCELVAQQARGERRDYRLEPRPLAPPGGQAEVFAATHKTTGTVVAFKRSRRRGDGEARRMRREVEIAQRLGANPHVMPVLDHSPAYDWFVMPKADATVEDKRTELQDPTRLRAVIDAVAAGLAEAHRHGWIHRDIKPANILLLDGRWMVADWGIVRRPRGQTSTAGLLTGAGIGTDGFAAPELSIDGHDITPTSDIYSLGQLIGWVLTGTWPRTNVPLLPSPGPWYGVVRQATQLDPAHRPQDIAAFLDLVDRETAAHTDLPIIRARLLLEDSKAGDATAAAQLLALAADHPGDYELYLEVVAALRPDTVEAVLLANPGQTTAVVEAMTGHAPGDRGDWPTFDEATRAIWWLLGVARHAARAEEWELLDAAAQGLLDWDGRWDRWGPRDSIQDWVRSLNGHAAAVVASALRAQPYGARLLANLKSERSVDRGVRSAIHAALTEWG